MISTENLRKIQEIVREFFKKTTFEIEIEFPPLQDQTFPIKIKTEEPQILIGERGQTLVEVQHLLKAILRKQVPEFSGYIDLDINDYKKKKIEYLKELAHSVADEVALTKKEKVLAPMQAYERRIIHLELAGRDDVTTESIGRAPERKIIVRPYP